MLIITRKPNEVLCIGPDVRVTVLGVKGNQVRLGITAPKAVEVDRDEVRQRKDAEGAAGVGPSTLTLRGRTIRAPQI